MNRGIAQAAVVLLALLLAGPALSIPITGEVEMSGSVTANSVDLETATTVSFLGAWTRVGTGSFEPISDHPRRVVYNSITFDEVHHRPRERFAAAY